MNTSKLKVLGSGEMRELLIRAHDGDRGAREKLIQGVQFSTYVVPIHICLRNTLGGTPSYLRKARFSARGVV